MIYNSLAVKSPVQNGQCEKGCEIKAGGQELAVMERSDSYAAVHNLVYRS